jgi:hypothetical protein
MPCDSLRRGGLQHYRIVHTINPGKEKDMDDLKYDHLHQGDLVKTAHGMVGRESNLCRGTYPWFR